MELISARILWVRHAVDGRIYDINTALSLLPWLHDPSYDVITTLDAITCSHNSGSIDEGPVPCGQVPGYPPVGFHCAFGQCDWEGARLYRESRWTALDFHPF